MRVTEMLVTLHTIRTHPGKDIVELQEIIHEAYRDNERLRFIAEDESHTALRWAIEDLNCVQERAGRYYFEASVRPYSKHKLMDLFIVNYLAQEAEKHAKKAYDGD